MRQSLVKTTLKILSLSVIIGGVSLYLIHDTKHVGEIIFVLGVLCVGALQIFDVKLRSVWPDIMFGIIDNGILVIMALFGAELAGASGAITGAIVGNAITDGIAGVFEGLVAEHLTRKNIASHRTILGSSLGKMAGCLLGAGAVLIGVLFLG